MRGTPSSLAGGAAEIGRQLPVAWWIVTIEQHFGIEAAAVPSQVSGSYAASAGPASWTCGIV
jgi:hypothetical protein